MDFEDYFEFLPEVLPALPLYVGVLVGAAVVQWGVKFYRRVHERHGTAIAACGLSGELVAQRLLAACGLGEVRVLRAGRRDLYHPWKREIRLSTLTFNNPSLGALVTAAHEVGHAQQFAEDILLCRARRIVWPVCWILTGIALLLPVLPFLGVTVVPIGHACEALMAVAVLSVMLQLPIHLPLEHDASRRARHLVQQSGLLAASEQVGFDKLATAAWLTYAAAEAQRCILVFVVGIALWFTPSFLEPSATDSAADDLHADTMRQAPPVALAGTEVTGSSHSMRQLETDGTEGSTRAADAVLYQQSDRLLGDEAEVPAFAGDSSVTKLPDQQPPGVVEALLPNVVILAVTLPACLLLGRLAQAGQAKRTVRERAIDRCNAGLALYEQGSLANAIAEFDEALRLDPSLATAYYNRGHTHLVLGRLDDAMSDLEAALRQEPGLVHAIVARGDVWIKRGDVERALAEYDTAHRMAPQNATVLTCRGYAWLLRRDYGHAFADFDLALKFNPKDPQARTGRGMVWLARADLERALADCDQAVSHGGPDAIIFATRGRVWLAKSQHDQAIADFTQALCRNEKDATVLRDRGLAWYFKNEFHRALADLNESICLDASDAVTFNNRGAALLKIGDHARATADLRESLRLDPNLPNAIKNLAWLQATCPDPTFRNGAQAVIYATRALELTEWKSVEWLSILAAAHAEAGNFDAAVNWQAKCLAESPPGPSTELLQKLELYRSRQPFRECLR